MPEPGPERLAALWKLVLEEDESILSDVLHYLNTVPRNDLFEFKAQMTRRQIVEGFKDSEEYPIRLIAYARLLAVCGSPTDAQEVAAMLARIDAGEVKAGRAELFAAHAVLKGPAALDEIDRRLTRVATEHGERLELLEALRAIGEISPKNSGIPRERLLKSLHGLLDDARLAPDAIAVLAHVEDWKLVDRLAEKFQQVPVRRAIFAFLVACPTAEGKKLLEELKEQTPEGWQEYQAGVEAARRERERREAESE
jgi:hypothetical protein